VSIEMDFVILQMAHRRKRKKTADYYNYVLYNLNILTMISLFFLVSLEKFI